MMRGIRTERQLVPQNRVPLRAVLGRNFWQIVQRIAFSIPGVTIRVMKFEAIRFVR
jgi:hypothetical protein